MAVNNNIAYLTKYAPELLDKVFARESLTESILKDNGMKVEFLDARTVKIPKLATTGLTDYKRGGSGAGNTRGAVSTAWETFTLSQERYSEIPLDTLDEKDSGAYILGNLSTEFIRTKVIGEVDTYRFSKLASYTNITFGNRAEGLLTSENILSEINKAFKVMANNHVPVENQVIYMSASAIQLLRDSNKVVKYLSQEDYRKDVTFLIESYEGRRIIEVPEDRFYTDVKIDTVGYGPAATSKKINFLVVDTKCAAVVKKLDFAKVFDSVNGGTYLGFVGYLLTNLIYHDIFVPDNKVGGIYANISTEIAAGNTGSVLNVAAEKGAGGGATKIVRALTQPAGILYDKLYLKKAAGVVEIGAATGGFTEIHLNEDFTPDPSHNIFVASLDGKAVASSKDFLATLPHR